MARPVIGLTTYAEQARFGRHDTMSAVLPMAYVHAVHASGGRAVLIVPHEPDPDVLACLNGIVLTGGPDVDPARYGAEPHSTTRSRPERDEAEAVLLRAALDADLPLLGVCRGMQLMAVEAGGRLHQHLPDLLGCDRHQDAAASSRPVPEGSGGHDVLLAAGTQANRLLGVRVSVNSYHHQAVADAGAMRAIGWCPQDGIVEAIDDPDRTFVLGVQWHPEHGGDLRVFAGLVEAAAARAAGGGPRLPQAA